jgi:hypothetical protein
VIFILSDELMKGFANIIQCIQIIHVVHVVQFLSSIQDEMSVLYKIFVQVFAIKEWLIFVNTILSKSVVLIFTAVISSPYTCVHH